MTWDWDEFSGDVLYLDSNIFIFSVEQGNPWSEVLRGLFEAVDERSIEVFTSELTLAEVLAKPLALGAHDLVEKYEQFLASDSVVRVTPIDRPILRLASMLRSQMGVKLMDAIHVATAKHYSCDLFLSQDKALGRKLSGELRWLQLADIESDN
jgi:uncharacterized protein